MILLKNARIVDGSAPAPSDPVSILIEGGTIREVGANVASLSGGDVLDLGGRTLMPGLIDAHVHVVACNANLGINASLPDALVAHRSAKIMHAMLMRGFTTVRDVGGATHPLRMARDEGLFDAPRLNISGKALSQTGGHTDFRGRFEDRPQPHWRLGAMGRICDGVPELRRAAREEIKNGADFIKIMANGGVASPTDPIHFLGFSREEITAVVEEARNAGTYVAAHLYTDEAIARAVECGVHSLEHCNLITPATARAAAAAGCFAVPTLVTYEALANEGASMGFPPDSVAKIETVRGAGMKSLEIIKEAGLPMAFGTDLLAEMHRHQSEEFVIRGRVLPAQEVIASATFGAAKLLRMEGRIGCIAPGAHADLVVVDGNPLADLALLTRQGAHMPAIMLGGRFVKNTL
ncbi:metal-dependent hydrolase family protein [Elioraea rosea]|uniref:metal-dependent hydrolase family protein n=1 Tax=Elioraea rosea TaxID=2492390 RepID=UPI0011843D26|nr:amidohydrolase family protein [Elioraea rosea]